MEEPNEFLRQFNQNPNGRVLPSASGVRRALGILKGAADVVPELGKELTDPDTETGRSFFGGVRGVGDAISGAAAAVAPLATKAIESVARLGTGDPKLQGASGKVRGGTERPPEFATQRFKDGIAADERRREYEDIVTFPDMPQQAAPSQAAPAPELVFPKATDQQNHPGWEADREKAAADRRQQFNQTLRDNAEKNRLRFPEPPAPPQGADSMDRLMGRSAANGFPISDAPPRGFALPGHEPKNFSAADAIDRQADERAGTISAMAQEMGVGPQNQFPSDIDQKIAAVRRASGKPPLPVDSDSIEAGAALSFPPTPDEISARKAEIVAAAELPRTPSGAINPGLGTGVLSPSVSNRLAVLARDAQKQKDSKSAEEATAKLKADAAAQQERVKAERQRLATEKAEKDSAEKDRLAAEAENTRRHSPMAGMGGVMISPAERMTADTNISGRYSGPVGSRSAPMAMSPQDVLDVADWEGSPATADGAGFTPDYDILADKMGLPADMDPDERLEKAMVFWGDQISRSKNSDIREAQGGGFYFSPTEKAKERYKQAGLRADARSIKTTYPRNQSGGQEHIDALDAAVDNNRPEEIGEIRKKLYDDRNTATAAFIRDRGRMAQTTRNMTDPRLAPAALAESLKAATTPQQKAEVYRQFGRADLADQIETRLSAEGEAERGRLSTERMHRLDDATKNAQIQSGERVGIAGADASKAGTVAKAGQEEKELGLKERQVVVQEKDQESEAEARRTRAAADAQEREEKKWGPGDAQEAAATRVLAPILAAGAEETPRALAEVPAIVKKHYMNVKQMMQDNQIEGAETYTEQQAGEELLRQALRGKDATQHPVLRVWVATESKRMANEAKKVSGWGATATKQKQYEAFRQGMARIGIDESSPLFKEAMNSNGISAPARAGS